MFMSKFRYTASMAVLAACIAGTAAAQENEAVVSEIVASLDRDSILRDARGEILRRLRQRRQGTSPAAVD